MEAFYTLASVDYQHLAKARDWRVWFEAQQANVGARPLRLLDVACGSGKFPAALVRDAHLGSAAIRPVDYALLDPSTFSLAEARRALEMPFVAGRQYPTTLQDLDCQRGAFDIVWATHALYALPAAELQLALERFMHALAGTGVIAHACEDSHYLRFYRHFLDAFHAGEGTPYTSAEQIAAMLERMGVAFQIEEIVYENQAPQTHDQRVQGYLQRCVFNDTVDLAQMLAHPITGAYLQRCLREGEWRFAQRALLLFIEP
jgi:SAM-dependent methyltransferase